MIKETLLEFKDVAEYKTLRDRTIAKFPDYSRKIKAQFYIVTHRLISKGALIKLPKETTINRLNGSFVNQ